jgi:hypothetical protein
VAALTNRGSSCVVHKILTADGRGSLKNGCHLWVHLNAQIFLHHDLLVPGLHLRFDPATELLLQDRGANIRKPLLRYLWELKLWFR